ncbi:MAG: nucleotide sugar dehydrogenase [Deltaproteobacteria bacterium HGW-Deltaproteobacteria-15]|jgi:UDPglucose 6-dehydrogenase|nr:MAG: nucleotide sugar dehydrogenase [Deltaproteobacteria bacterium HGW-Deltaproteobacteria-15]
MEGTEMKRILCIGAGYVGGPSMVVIAEKCPHHRITVVDCNPDKIAQWRSDSLPIYEPGLDEAVKRVRDRNLFFSIDVEKGIKESEIIFVSVNTPTKNFGVGSGQAADLQYWEKTARQIVENAESPKIIVEKSTVPVKTAQAMEEILKMNQNGKKMHVISNPEFLAEGTAMNDLEHPDRVLIGSHESEEAIRARQELVDIYAHWVPRERILTSNIWSSELAKLASNAFLAQRISSINSFSALCEKTGADVTEVARAVGMDSRIGARFLAAGIGFGGSCFKKDILNLVYLCHHYGLPDVARYWEEVVRINEFQKERFVLNMIQSMFNTLSGKRICLFGFAFKANTGDTRESPAISIARRLLEENAHVVITDPKALKNARDDLAEIKGAIDFVEDPYAAACGCDAIAVMTEWEIYRNLDYEEVFSSMRKPAYLFDGRNILDHRELQEIGYSVYPIGKPPMVPL